MNAMLDTIMAMIIVGLFILASFQVDTTMKMNAIYLRYQLHAQQGATVMSDIVEYDMRKIGHGLRQPLQSIHSADSTQIIFSFSQDVESGYDSIRVNYYTETGISQTNPDLIRLHRISGGDHHTYTMGLTSFKLRYFNQRGTELPRPVPSDSLASIKQIELDMTFSSKEEIDGERSHAQYHSRITPKNLLVQYGRN